MGSIEHGNAAFVLRRETVKLLRALMMVFLVRVRAHVACF